MTPENSKRFNPFRQFSGAFIAEWLLRRTEVSNGAKICYARLVQFAGRNGCAWPGQQELAACIGVTDRTARDYVKELERHGLIDTEQRGLQRSNVYFFLRHEWMESAAIIEPDEDIEEPTSVPDRKNHVEGLRNSSGQDRRKSSAPYRGRESREENQGNRESSPNGERGPRPASRSTGLDFLAGMDDEPGAPDDQPVTANGKYKITGPGCKISSEMWKMVYARLKETWPDWKPRQSHSRDQGLRKWINGRGAQSVEELFEAMEAAYAVSDYLRAVNGHKGPGDNGKAVDPSWIWGKNQAGVWRFEKLMDGGYSNESMAFVLNRPEPIQKVELIEVWCDGKTMRVPRHTVGEGPCRYWITGEQSGIVEVMDNGVDWNAEKYEELKRKSQTQTS